MQPKSLPTYRYTSTGCYVTNSYIGKISTFTGVRAAETKAFCDVMLSALKGTYWCFGEKRGLCLHSRRYKYGESDSCNTRDPFYKLHGVTSQKTVILTSTTLINSNSPLRQPCLHYDSTSSWCMLLLENLIAFQYVNKPAIFQLLHNKKKCSSTSSTHFSSTKSRFQSSKSDRSNGNNINFQG